MPEQEKSTTWAWIERLREFGSKFQLVRELLTFTLLVFGTAMWWYRDSELLLPYLTTIIVAHLVCLTVLGVARMKYGPPK